MYNRISYSSQRFFVNYSSMFLWFSSLRNPFKPMSSERALETRTAGLYGKCLERSSIPWRTHISHDKMCVFDVTKIYKRSKVDSAVGRSKVQISTDLRFPLETHVPFFWKIRQQKHTLSVKMIVRAEIGLWTVHSSLNVSFLVAVFRRSIASLRMDGFSLTQTNISTKN